MEIALVLAAAALVLSILGEAMRFLFPSLNRWLTSNIKVLLKQDEGTKVLGSTYLVAGATLAMALFPKPVAVAGLLFTTVGDPVAALVGERIGRRRIFRKSLEGSAAMLAVTLTLGLGLSRIYPVPLLALVLGAAIATVAEALPLPVDDNLTIPAISGGAMILLLPLLPVG